MLASVCQMSVFSRGTPCTRRRPPTVVRPCAGRAGAIRTDSFAFAGLMERRAFSRAAISPAMLPRSVESIFLKRMYPGQSALRESQDESIGLLIPTLVQSGRQRLFASMERMSVSGQVASDS